MRERVKPRFPVHTILGDCCWDLNLRPIKPYTASTKIQQRNNCFVCFFATVPAFYIRTLTSLLTELNRQYPNMEQAIRP